MIADLDLDGEYDINGTKWKGRDLAMFYQNLIVENVRDSFEEVRRMFEDENGDINYPVLITHLREEIKRRDLDEEYYKAI